MSEPYVSKVFAVKSDQTGHMATTSFINIKYANTPRGQEEGDFCYGKER